MAWNGQHLLQRPAGLPSISSAMLGMEYTEVGEDVLDAIAEMGNMIIGGFKTVAEDHLGPLGLSIPTVIYGLSFSARSAGKEKWIVVPFRCSGDTLELRICLTRNRILAHPAAVETRALVGRRTIPPCRRQNLQAREVSLKKSILPARFAARGATAATTTTTGASAATAVTAATAKPIATTTAAAESTSARFARAGFVHRQSSAAELGAIQGRHRFIGIPVHRHFHKRKSASLPRIPILHNLHPVYLAVCGKCRIQILLSRLE